MNITSFLAQIWGPVLLVVGAGFFTSRKYYLSIYKHLEKQAFALLMFGMLSMVIGIVHIKVHNMWNTLPEIIISFLGWSLTLKGILCLVAPRFVDQTADRESGTLLITSAGIVMLILGAYLCIVGYFM